MGVKVVGLQKLINDFGRAPDVLKEETARGYENMMDFVIERIQANTPVFKGGLRDSFEGKLLFGGLVAEITSSAPEVIVASVEGGARPHWPPWGPGSELAAWAEAKGIPPFLVARAISRRGTIKRFGYKGARMVGRGLEDSEIFIAKESQRIGSRFVAEAFR